MRKENTFSKDFILMVIGQIVSLFGNQILRYALPLYLLNQTGSSALFGSISAIAYIPMIILCPIGGIIADRVNKRNIMVILDFCTAALILLFDIFSGSFDMIPLIAVTMVILYAIQGAYQPAVQASVPVLVKADHIMQANSAVTLVNSLAAMLGPVIGGLLFSFFGLKPILYASIGCFFLSAVMEIFIYIPFGKEKRTDNIFAAGINDLKESFDVIFHKLPILWKISLLFALANMLLTSLLLIGIPVVVTQYMGFSADKADRLYGYAQGFIAAGSLLGGLFAGILSKKLKAGACPYLLIGSAAFIVLGGLALQLLHIPMLKYIVLIAGCGIFMLLASIFSVQMMTYLQMITPKKLIGKVISCVLCLCMCSNPAGQLIYGFLFGAAGNKNYLLFYIAPLIMIAVSIIMRRSFLEVEQMIAQNDREAR